MGAAPECWFWRPRGGGGCRMPIAPRMRCGRWISGVQSSQPAFGSHVVSPPSPHRRFLMWVDAGMCSACRIGVWPDAEETQGVSSSWHSSARGSPGLCTWLERHGARSSPIKHIEAVRRPRTYLGVRHSHASWRTRLLRPAARYHCAWRAHHQTVIPACTRAGILKPAKPPRGMYGWRGWNVLTAECLLPGAHPRNMCVDMPKCIRNEPLDWPQQPAVPDWLPQVNRCISATRSRTFGNASMKP